MKNFTLKVPILFGLLRYLRGDAALPGALVFFFFEPDSIFWVQAEIMNAANNPEVGPAHTADFGGMWDLDVALGMVWRPSDHILI